MMDIYIQLSFFSLNEERNHGHVFLKDTSMSTELFDKV